jgi:excisionase family DNA binding protein
MMTAALDPAVHRSASAAVCGHDDQHHEYRRPETAGTFHHVGQRGRRLATSRSQIYALLRSGELKGIQIGGRNQWRIERVKLEEFIQEAYRRADAALQDLPDDLTEPDDK